MWWHRFFLSFFNPNQDWGRPGDLWNLDIRWHVPSAEETSFAFYLLEVILQPELQRLQRFAQGEQDLTRWEGATASYQYKLYSDADWMLICWKNRTLSASAKGVYCMSVFCFFSPSDDVLQSLTIIQHCLLGAGGLLPPLKGEPIPEL